MEKNKETIWKCLATFIKIGAHLPSSLQYPGLTKAQRLQIGDYEEEARIITLYLPNDVVTAMHEIVEHPTKNEKDQPPKIIELYLRMKGQMERGWKLRHYVFEGEAEK